MSKRPSSSDFSEYELKTKPRKSGKKDKERHDYSIFGQKETKIPEILKNNIKNLTDKGETFDSSETFDLTVPKTPSPKKSSKKTLLSRLIKSSEKKPKHGDKRLLALKGENINTSLLSSPSMMIMAKKDHTGTSTPITEMEIDKAEYESKLEDSFDKMMNDQKSEKIEGIKASNSKTFIAEKLPTIKEISVEPPKINSDIIEYFKGSQKNFRQAIEGIKSINASILEFRRLLALKEA